MSEREPSGNRFELGAESVESNSETLMQKLESFLIEAGVNLTPYQKDNLRKLLINHNRNIGHTENPEKPKTFSSSETIEISRFKIGCGIGDSQLNPYVMQSSSSKPMFLSAGIERQQELIVNPDFNFGDVNSFSAKVLDAFEGLEGSGKYKTITPAVIEWSRNSERTKIVSKGKVQLVI